MKKSNLRFLGLLGFIGLLALLTDNYGYAGFFGFFGFWGFSGVKNDELLRRNLARAGFNAFIVGLLSLSVAIVALSLVKSLLVAALSIASVFILQLLTFIISFSVYERKGN
jgi:hypothetical protein